jgi:hypothetical protein
MPTNSLTPRYAVWFPGKNALETRSNSALVSWQSSASNAVLSFPGPGGKLKRIIVGLP